MVSARAADRLVEREDDLAARLVPFLTAAAVLYVPIYMAMVHVAGWNGKESVNPNYVLLSALVLVQVGLVTMVYGPIAAFLVELFPTRVRYTSLSVPYHIGNGIFGGLVPVIATALEKGTGNLYAGVSCPIAIAAICAVIGGFFIKEKRDVKWNEEGDQVLEFHEEPA